MTNHYPINDINVYFCIGDWSLITGKGATNGRGGGHVKFYPYKKRGGKSFSHAEGGGAQQVLV